ncbi:MAG: SPOR domain-containing protein [Bacteroidales bacterium]|nr:SPOR domain-containing protein [Bacteroidales bacterium]
MTGLPSYISDLLYFNDCVIVPGFGGFIADYFPGGSIEGNNNFSPPAKRIAFNLHIRENDYLLSSHIQKKEKISNEQASFIIESFVNNTYKSLSFGEKVILDGLGTFFINAENRLKFIPDNTTNFLIDSFGLNAFHFPVIVDKNQIRRLNKEFQKTDPLTKKIKRHRILRTVIAAPLVMAMLIAPFYSNLLNNSYFSSINPFSSGHKRVEITSPRAIDSAFINPNSLEESVTFLTNKKNALYYSGNMKKNEVQAINKKEDSTKVVEEEIVNKIDSDLQPETIIPQPKIEETKTYNNLKYHIIAGSLQTQKQAEKFAKTLIDKGFEPVILPIDNKGRIRISIAGFDSQTSAINQLDSIRKNTEIQVWLLTK